MPWWPLGIAVPTLWRDEWGPPPRVPARAEARGSGREESLDGFLTHVLLFYGPQTGSLPVHGPVPHMWWAVPISTYRRSDVCAFRRLDVLTFRRFCFHPALALEARISALLPHSCGSEFAIRYSQFCQSLECRDHVVDSVGQVVEEGGESVIDRDPEVFQGRRIEKPVGPIGRVAQEGADHVGQ